MYSARDVEPMGSRLILLPIQRDEVTREGLILANTSDDPPTMAEVVAVGPAAAAQFAVGDVVIYGKYHGTPVSIATEHVIILDAADVLIRIQRASAGHITPLGVLAEDARCAP